MGRSWEVTSDFCYVWLHGPGDAYQGCYDEAALTGWARQLLIWSKVGQDFCCYFDNDENGFATTNAAQLLAFLKRRRANVALSEEYQQK